MKVSDLRDVLKPGTEVVITIQRINLLDEFCVDDIKISVNQLYYENWLMNLKVQVIYVSEHDNLIHILTC